MKIMSTRIFIIYGFAALVGVALFHTSQSVQRAEEKRDALLESIAREEERIRMLKAEWVHLNRPERLEALADEFLKLGPASSDHIVDKDVFVEPQEVLQEESIEVQPVVFETPVPVLAPPVKPAPQAEPEILPKPKHTPSKSFDNLLDELESGNGGVP